MIGFILTALLLSNIAFAEVGKILKIQGTQDAQINRGAGKFPATMDGSIEEGDEIETNNSTLIFHLYPSTQIILNKNSRIQITQSLIQESEIGEEITSVIKLIKGLIRLQITKDINQKINQEVNVGDVSFGVRGTDFEVYAVGSSDVDLDVYEGEVTVSSPHVQTFVPEVIKANEGFRFSRKQKQFIRRRFHPRFKNHPGFLSKLDMQQRWKKVKPEGKFKKLKTKIQKREKKQR